MSGIRPFAFLVLLSPGLAWAQAAGSPLATPAPATTPAPACKVSGIPIQVCHYVGGFGPSNCCRGTLMYDATGVSFIPSKGLSVGARPAVLCTPLCLDLAAVTEIGENAFLGADVGAFHVKADGASHDFAPVDFAGKPQKFRTKEMVKVFKEKTGK
jgi:hypothetical protein